MPDFPIVGTATVGAPGVTRKPTLLITAQPLFHLSYRCELVGAGSRTLTRILRHTEATLWRFKGCALAISGPLQESSKGNCDLGALVKRCTRLKHKASWLGKANEAKALCTKR